VLRGPCVALKFVAAKVEYLDASDKKSMKTHFSCWPNVCAQPRASSHVGCSALLDDMLLEWAPWLTNVNSTERTVR
jgi:hypothetical protein